VATEQDAARDRVLAARADLAGQLELLEASGRAAIDIPAKIRRSPAKAAAVAGGVGFLVLKGPQRLFRAGRRVVRGKPAPLPAAMLPDEIEKALRSLGSDGDKVRGALERDFAAYAKQAKADRQRWRTIVAVAAARPLLLRGSKAVAEYLFATDGEGFAQHLAQVRERASKAADGGDNAVADGSDDATATDDGAPTGI
jgi:hypothetical protein